MLIQIERPVRVTLLDTEVQALKTGDIYDVSPVIGQVLVSDGWARELNRAVAEAGGTLAEADDDPGEPSSNL